MAEPVDLVERRRAGAEEEAELSLERLAFEVARHEEAIREALRLLQALHDHGWLRLAAALLENGDRVAARGLEELARPRNLRALRNLVAIAGTLSRVEPAQVERLSGGLAPALQAAADRLEAGEPVGLLGLARQAREPAVNRGLQALLAALAAFGRAAGEGLQAAPRAEAARHG
ncbi:MAG: DUF1641 domain-containing protein [Bacillota bacterium]|nr:DUF1641 domain-containing protein [Bacillota bacterium]